MRLFQYFQVYFHHRWKASLGYLTRVSNTPSVNLQPKSYILCIFLKCLLGLKLKSSGSVWKATPIPEEMQSVIYFLLDTDALLPKKEFLTAAKRINSNFLKVFSALSVSDFADFEDFVKGGQHFGHPKEMPTSPSPSAFDTVKRCHCWGILPSTDFPTSIPQVSGSKSPS